MLSTWLFTLPTANAEIGKPAANCSAANLSQALLGIGNSQLGIVNNATIPLFVVCSVDVDALPVTDVQIDALIAAPGGDITCTYRAGIKFASGFATASVTITCGENGVTPPMDSTV